MVHEFGGRSNTFLVAVFIFAMQLHCASGLNRDVLRVELPGDETQATILPSAQVAVVADYQQAQVNDAMHPAHLAHIVDAAIVV